MRNTTEKILANIDLLVRAWVNFYRYHKVDPHNHHVWDPDFWKLVPSREWNHAGKGWLLSPEDYRRAEAIAGPHYYAMLKVYYAKKQTK